MYAKCGLSYSTYQSISDSVMVTLCYASDFKLAFGCVVLSSDFLCVLVSVNTTLRKISEGDVIGPQATREI